jgi:hypothetical protein
MASPSKKAKTPTPQTGTSKRLNKAKGSLRNGQAGMATATRPMVPDDVNSMSPRPYENWQPGKVRPFQPQFRFNIEAPSKALCGGPGMSVGGKLNGIDQSKRMYGQDVFGNHGWSKK